LRRLLPALVGLLALCFLLPVDAFAHASVVSVEPAPSLLPSPPGQVRITFSEPVTAFGRGIDVISPSGRLVSAVAHADGDSLTAALAAAEQGTYLVEWRVVAQDTHPSRGTYTFSVGRSSAVPSGLASSSDLGAVAPLGLVLQALARWLHFLGFALAFGTIAFQLLVLSESQPTVRLRVLVNAGIVLLLLAEPIALLAQALSLGSVDSASVADVLGSAFGRVLALRLAAPLLLWGILGAIRQSRGAGGWAVLVLGAALAGVDGLAGHTIRGQPAVYAYLLTAVHVASMALWVGGFAALLAVLPGSPDRRPLVGRFGRYLLYPLAALLLSGTALALVHLQSPGDLLFSSYGLTLAIKLVAVAAALLAARLGVRRIRSGRPEAVALAGIVALASLLASLPPPR
jgi:copper transport protein